MATAGGVLFHALWWTHYVTFCALAVVYVWEILQSSPPSNGENRPKGPYGADLARLIDIAERCRGHLASSTPVNSPSRRYSIILEELRLEAKSQSSRRDAQQPPTGGQAHEHASGAAGTCMEMQESFGGDHDVHLAGLFPGDTGAEGVNNLLAGWQMNDWLDLDSSVRSLRICKIGLCVPNERSQAFAPLENWDMDESPVAWTLDVG